MNCCVAPVAKLAVLGVTAMAVIVLDVTVRAAVPLSPLRVAVMVVDPGDTPVARPIAPMGATDGVVDAQVAVEVTLAVELSL